MRSLRYGVTLLSSLLLFTSCLSSFFAEKRKRSRYVRGHYKKQKANKYLFNPIRKKVALLKFYKCTKKEIKLKMD